jgi:hypothetical protein
LFGVVVAAIGKSFNLGPAEGLKRCVGHNGWSDEVGVAG